MVGETAKRKRSPFLALFVMVMILLHTSDCGATSSIMKGNASSPYHARIDEAADYWMFDSEITRMLADKPHATDNTDNPNVAAIDCGRAPDYKPCIQAKKNNQPIPETCDPYKRKGC
jgi:hypothetical protein